MDTLILLAGLALLLVSAHYFIEGIAAVAGALGVPPLVIGMTVVAFGTSTPELVVNVLSAWRGETALAFGNIAGSCIVNAGFVLGVTALVRPLKVEPSLITREIPMLIVAVAALLILAGDSVLNGTANVLSSRRFNVFIGTKAVAARIGRCVCGRGGERTEPRSRQPDAPGAAGAGRVGGRLLGRGLNGARRALSG